MATANFTWTPVPGSYGTLIEYKKDGDVSWTTPTVPDNPTIYNTYTLTLDAGFYYYVRFTTISPTCANKFIIKKIFVSTGASCCPIGYTLSPDSSYCYLEEVAAADVTGGSPQLLCHFTSPPNYGNYGAVIYKPGKYNVDGTWNISDPTAKPEILVPSTGLGYNVAAFNSTTITVPHVWLNSDYSVAVDSRLNKSGVWKCGDQNYTATPLGFSRQINVPTTKTYYIGVGSDNFAEIKINGVTILNQDITTLSSSTYFNEVRVGFRYWHIYPVTLINGPNLISLTGTNSGLIGIMGFEIYDATELQLMAVNTDGGLNSYIIFSTKDIVNNSPSDVANYSCTSNPTYTLVYDAISNTYSCKKITTSGTIPCSGDLIYFGSKPSGTSPTEAEILIGSTSVADGSVDVSLNWGTPDGVPKFYWLAIPNNGPTYVKNRWEEIPPNMGNMGTISDTFGAPTLTMVAGIQYNVWITNYLTEFTIEDYIFSKV